MNPIIYCRQVGRLLSNYNEEVAGYDRDKYLVSTDRSEALLSNACLVELIEPTDTGILIAVSPQQIVDYITDTIKEGRDALDIGSKNDNYTFEVRQFPRLILHLLSNPGLAKLIKLAQPKL